MRGSLHAFLALVLLSPATARAEDPSTWNPKDTYVLVASVIEWPGNGLAAFKDPRRDEALVEQFKACGVPSGNVVFLKDREATKAAMKRELEALAGRAAEGSTFVFYFQGHGLRRKEKMWLACYDVNVKDYGTAFDVDELAPVFERSWKGTRLLLVGDCCHSGALGRVVDRLDGKRGIRAACLASATASNTSTSHWTFTEALISALAGDGRVDRDRDGTIAFSEVEAYAHDEMKYRENQLCRSRRGAAFEGGFVLRAVAPDRPAPAKVDGPWQVLDWVEARDREGKWYVSQILEAKDGKYFVHFAGWDPKWDEWVGPKLVRPIERPKLTVGRRYEIEWRKNQWYLATVTKEDDGFYFIHYEGEEGDEDEWVTSDRARPAPAGAAPPPPEFAALAPRAAAAGDRVAARWRKAWYLAKVVAVEGGVHSVVYDDGDTGALSAADLIPVAAEAEIAAGERVLACWDGKPRMYPGLVEKKTSKGCVVSWEDGTKPSEVPFGQIARIRSKGK
jgi:hypothetical protein